MSKKSTVEHKDLNDHAETKGEKDINRDAPASDIQETVYAELHFPGWHDWDEGARPFLNIFLKLHPNWTDEDFNNILIPDLQNRGYGWLLPEGVRKELIKMSERSFLKIISAKITKPFISFKKRKFGR